MSKIYELNEKQIEILGKLEWLDEAEDSKEIEKLTNELSKIQTSATHTLEFLADIMLQAQYDESVANDEVKRLALLAEIAKKRANKHYKASERLNSIMVRICNDFNIKTFKTGYHEFKKTITPGSIQLLPDFDIDKLPSEFVRVIPEEKRLDSASAIRVLRDKLKTESGKLCESIKVVDDEALPGVLLVRTESIK